MDEILNENFLVELFKLCLKKKEIIEVCKKVLKYQYLPSDGYKEVWKQIKDEFDFTNTIPTLGVLYQNCKDNKKALEVLKEIKDISFPDENQVIKSLESFIKNSICIEFYDNFQELYAQGNRDKAIKLLNDTGEKLNTFSLSSNYLFTSIFKDFRDRQYQNKIDLALRNEDYGFHQPVFGIDEIDLLYPIKKNTICCTLACSGIGKTTHLISTAVENARRGAGVLYVTSEGTIKELQDKFDACWTATDKFKLENADLSDVDIAKLSKLAEQVTALGGEVELHVFTQFGTATILDIYNLVEEYEKIHGKVPNVLCIDYLELFTVHDKHFTVGEEKYRRQAVARAISNLVTSKNIDVCFTATQASDVSAELLNSEEFVLTRNNISGDKNLADAFSLFLTLNQTQTEYQNQVLRIFIDKSRHSSKLTKQIFHIATDYGHGNFYDRKRTLKQFASSLI